MNEKKQAFNAYKTQKQKEEKEEERKKLKQNKEQLENFLQTCEYMNSTIKYAKAEKMFSHLSVWLGVPEKERKELYEDVLFIIEKREKEDAKNLRKRNIKVLKDILESMSKVTHKTRWSEAQKLLFKDPYFTQDMVNILHILLFKLFQLNKYFLFLNLKRTCKIWTKKMLSLYLKIT